MRRFEVFPGLHFQQAGFGSLEFKAKAAASIEFGDRCSGRDDDFDVAVVELVDHVDEAASLVIFFFAQDWHIADDDGVELPGRNFFAG